MIWSSAVGGNCCIIFVVVIHSLHVYNHLLPIFDESGLLTVATKPGWEGSSILLEGSPYFT